MRFVVGAILVLVTALFARAPVWAVDITTCGETVGVGETGVLQADLDCSGESFGVRVRRHTTLDLNGHSIAGDEATVATVLGAGNADDTGQPSFTIRGPGVISGTRVGAAGTGACVELHDGVARITSATGMVDVRGCFTGVRGSFGDAAPFGRVKLDHVYLHDTFRGTSVNAVAASDVTASDNQVAGLWGGRTSAIRVIAVNNGNVGVGAATNLRGRHVVATGNGTGAGAGRSLRIDDLTATDNVDYGAYSSGHLKLLDSVLTGNGAADVESQDRPMLVNTTCGKGRSFDLTSWHVCGD